MKRRFDEETLNLSILISLRPHMGMAPSQTREISGAPEALKRSENNRTAIFQIYAEIDSTLLSIKDSKAATVVAQIVQITRFMQTEERLRWKIINAEFRYSYQQLSEAISRIPCPPPISETSPISELQCR